MTTWTTEPLHAWLLAPGDRFMYGDIEVTATSVRSTRDATSVEWDGGGHTVDPCVTVMVVVPDEPVDGYSLWKPRLGTFSYSGCTCVHRRQVNGSWAVPGGITPDCPGCTAALLDDWND